MHPEHRSIGELAYRLWQARGCPQGTAEQDWLDAERQLRLSQRATGTSAAARAAESRAAESVASDATDRSLEDTFPASDPPASHRKDEPPANADAKWKAAGAARTTSAARPRRSKSSPGKPSADPPH